MSAENAERTGHADWAARANRAAVRLGSLGMRFGKVEALRGIDAEIPSGRISALVGPDAAGKTTLMRLLAGLMRPTTGAIEIFGQTPEELASGAESRLGYMPQRFGLYEDLSVEDNLRLHARLRGLEGAEREALFARLLSFTALGPFAARLAGRLSGGMKQKLGVACALLGNPDLLLLDEPGVGVDPQSRRELWRMVEELAGAGMTIIWSTAYLEEAERCPHVLMLDAGRLVYAGAPEEMLERVRGRVYACVPSGDLRAGLKFWMERKDVLDVLAQGSKVRLLAAKNLSEATRAELDARGAQPARPRLEDAYMDVLGGIGHAPSPFGRIQGRETREPGQAGFARPECSTRLTPPPAAPCGRIQGREPCGPGQAGFARPDPVSVEPAIRALGLSKNFGAFVAARDISFEVAPGRIFGLLGPNGAGKSTTFRMLCGLLQPSGGECFVAGVNLLHAGSEARARLGYMAQAFSLYPDISAAANIRIMADLYGLSAAERRERTELLVEALELGPFLKQHAGLLPLGQKRRLALVCATLHKPSVLFLDEPTSGVDARTRREFWKHINAATETGTAVLVTTHFMEEAEYCDEIALIYRGAIITRGTPDELKAACPAPEGGEATLEDAFIAGIEEYERLHPV